MREPRLPHYDESCALLREIHADANFLDSIDDLPTLVRIIEEMRQAEKAFIQIRVRADRELAKAFHKRSSRA
jgi:hypothetical protein